MLPLLAVIIFHVLINFTNSLDPNQAQQNIRFDLDP